MEFKTLRQNCPNWQDYIQHAFVHQLINGTLPHEAFLTYLQQDFLFLLQFTRA
ncbi:hypothetical protein [Suttonella ornithocola]|nr:hypothetical protein [Suttonella ornithocola]